MAQSPQWKVYSSDGEYVAAFKYVEDAAALADLRGEGTTIRAGHAKRFTVWTEGKDGKAGESYDHVREVAHRCCDRWRAQTDNYSAGYAYASGYHD